MIIGLMVTHNEAHRFLAASIGSLSVVCDVVCVYDDQSTDNTVEVASRHGAIVEIRPERVPSFIENEGAFRDAAWKWAERALPAGDGDWVVSLDADELLIGDRHGLRDVLTDADPAVDAVEVVIDELWQIRPPMRRIDGFWDRIRGVRIRRWEQGLTIAAKAMASGSVPKASHVLVDGNVHIAHLGYVRAEDRRAKHSRYSGRAGHSAKHVNSILQEPVLEPVTYPVTI